MMINHWNSLSRKMIKFPSFEVLISTGHLSQSHAIAQTEMKDLMLAMPNKSSLNLYYANTKMNRKDCCSSIKNKKWLTEFELVVKKSWFSGLSLKLNTSWWQISHPRKTGIKVKAQGRALQPLWTLQKATSSLVTEIRKKHLVHVYTQLSHFLPSDICSKITCLMGRPRIKKLFFVKTSIWGWYKYCTVYIYSTSLKATKFFSDYGYRC